MDLVFLINLPLGVFWLFLGGAILAYEYGYGRPVPHFLDISLGWWVLLLSLYNWSKVARALWFMRKPAEEPEEDQPETTLARRDKAPREQTPDPNFKFTDQPPPAPDNKSS
jgi:hypothetical protein